MEWQLIELKKEPKPRFRGRMTTHEQAKKAEEELKKGQPWDSAIAGWLPQKLVQWMEKNQPGSRKEGRRINAAGLRVMLSREIVREKALALGRRLVDPRVIALELEARWKKRKGALGWG